MSEGQLFELECGSGGGEPVPLGLHRAKFVGLEHLPATEKDGTRYGEAVRLKFEVVGGEHAGKVASNIGPTKPTPQNTTGRILASMGLDVGPGKKVNLRECIGREYNVAVQPNRTNRPVVGSAYPV